MAQRSRKCMHCNGIAAHTSTTTVNFVFATETFTCLECRKDIAINGYMMCGLFAAFGFITFVLVASPLNVLCALFFGGFGARSIHMRRKNPEIENLDAEIARFRRQHSQEAAPSVGGVGIELKAGAMQPQSMTAGFKRMPSFKMLWSIFGVVIFAALYYMGSSADANTKAADKAVMTKDFRLDADQGAVYDQCVSAMSRKKLKNGGSKAEFCGCVVKSATAEQPVASYGGIASNLSAIVLDESANKEMTAESLATLLNVGTAIRLCADLAARERMRYAGSYDDRRSSWSSQAELLEWCAAKRDRAQQPHCNLNRTQAR